MLLRKLSAPFNSRAGRAVASHMCKGTRNNMAVTIVVLMSGEGLLAPRLARATNYMGHKTLMPARMVDNAIVAAILAGLVGKLLRNRRTSIDSRGM